MNEMDIIDVGDRVAITQNADPQYGRYDVLEFTDDGALLQWLDADTSVPNFTVLCKHKDVKFVYPNVPHSAHYPPPDCKWVIVV